MILLLKAIKTSYITGLKTKHKNAQPSQRFAEDINAFSLFAFAFLPLADDMHPILFTWWLYALVCNRFERLRQVVQKTSQISYCGRLLAEILELKTYQCVSIFLLTKAINCKVLLLNVTRKLSRPSLTFAMFIVIVYFKSGFHKSVNTWHFYNSSV